MSDNNRAMEMIFDLLNGLQTENACMAPSFLFNEGWMLRLVLESAQRGNVGIIDEISGSTIWRSEAKLFTPFGKEKGKASESNTNADGVVGEFSWKPGTKTGVDLNENAVRFEVFEAKMYSKLSKGVKGANNYDQAARTIACMINTLAIKGLTPSNHKLKKLGFSIVAPRTQIQAGYFNRNMRPESIKAKVLSRIEQFNGDSYTLLNKWKSDFFEPWLEYLTENEDRGMQILAWEDIIESISDDEDKANLNWFYERCNEFGNRRLGGEGEVLMRGQKCKAKSFGDETLIVTNSRRLNSRVYVEGRQEGSRTIATRDLIPIENQLAETLVPPLGSVWMYQDKTVVIVSNGPAGSKAKTVPDGIELYVENHLLEKKQ